ncbi:uncharacterized protein JN550_007664 [Neoarthrinium moseri]|uniref:uncharacterized protein n=1 Tax=Neoarthrinium moseri TaxID=1658444 RepID=UPI001FDB9FA3|nr:uncharacterized protein JN550_007664 [Neoarthrinium moseri]KAI1866276.1 hypothetical protein JN550_007664 [Neoarthrinium moseri]
MANIDERKLLPAHVKPSSYEICLEPNFDARTFSGRVKILCHVLSPTRQVQLNGKNIVIEKAVIEQEGTELGLQEPVSYNDLEETIEITTTEELCSGSEVHLTLEYSGQFNEKCVGFYQSSYTDNDGLKHPIAATAMEPTYARQAFPCFDEPALKAKFTISALVDDSFECFSNMPVKQAESVSGSLKRVVFHETPLMSTYLVALLAGHLAKTQSNDARIPITLISPIGREDETKFSLDLACKGLHFFEQLFGLYPLPKLDLAAVPDFASGAQENWGLILFRAQNLLVDPEDSALDSRKNTARTILHEISHMWFGNLVTMKYWDGLWLKEGFANLMAWIATDKFFPSWTIWDHYVANDLQAALELDGLRSTHAVEQVVKNPTEAKQIYDEISYNKGCCVLKMISHEMGEESFTQGVKNYIDAFQYGSTESDDLWSSLEEVTDLPIKDNMHVWTKKSGFPVVKVNKRVDEASKKTFLWLTQHRFVASEMTAGTDSVGSSHTNYPLRITIKSESGLDTYDMSEQELEVPISEETWFKLNANHDGFYVTSYSSELLVSLIDAAAKNKLSLRDNVGMSCDLQRLVASGVNRTSDLLNLIIGFRHSSDYLVWETLDRNLRAVQSAFKFRGPKITDGLQRLSLEVFGTKAHELGWDVEGDDDTTTAFKASMFSSAGLAGNEKVVSAARELLDARVNGNDRSIPASLKWEVFGIVAAHGGREELQQLFNIWKTSQSEDERFYALECMGRTSTPELVQWVLGFSFTDDVKGQDLFVMLWLINSSPTGAIEFWQWAKQNWDKLVERVTEQHLGYILELLIDGLGTREQIADVENFFDGRDTAAYSMTLAGRLEHMKTRCSWSERDEEDITNWLVNHGFTDRSHQSSTLQG